MLLLSKLGWVNVLYLHDFETIARMEIKIDIPKYDAKSGFQYKWLNGFCIAVTNADGVVTLSANKEGLISMANHLLNLAQDAVPTGHHLHFDGDNSLEQGSVELIVEKRTVIN